MKIKLALVLSLVSLTITNSVFAHSNTQVIRKIKDVEKRIDIRKLEDKIDKAKQNQANTLVKIGLLENYLNSGYEAKFYSNALLNYGVLFTTTGGAAITAGALVNKIIKKITRKQDVFVSGAIVGVLSAFYLFIDLNVSEEHLLRDFLKVRVNFSQKIESSDASDLKRIEADLQEDLKTYSLEIESLHQELDQVIAN